jgi:hypothetical protein
VRASDVGLANAYRGGRVLDGRLLRDVPVIDLRGTSNQEIHTDYHSWLVRARLDAAGGHRNQVIWTGYPLTVDPVSYDLAFDVMDDWLTRLSRDHRSVPRAAKVAASRPAAATDSCFVAGQQVRDMSLCSTVFPYYGDARTAASAPLRRDVLACALKPAARLPGFTDGQWRRWQAVFPSGVCDWSRPGRRQQPAVPWTSYSSGPPAG